MALEACCGPAAALLHGGPADPVALGEDAYALPCGSARDVGLDQGAPVVSRRPLPAHAAALGDEPQMPVPPHRRGSGRVARHRARARRDYDAGIRMPGGDPGVNVIPIVGTIAGEGRHRIRIALNQGRLILSAPYI